MNLNKDFFFFYQTTVPSRQLEELVFGVRVSEERSTERENVQQGVDRGKLCPGYWVPGKKARFELSLGAQPAFLQAGRGFHTVIGFHTLFPQAPRQQWKWTVSI